MPQPVGPSIRMFDFCSSTSGLSVPNALIMVIHSDRQRALRIFLTDDVLIELGLDLRRTQQRFGLRRLIDLGHILVQNIIAKLDALIADENAGSGDQAAHLLLRSYRRRSTSAP